MNITVSEELQAYIDPLTPDEHAALERSLLAEGCRDALVLWGELLVDGHNRYGICRQHGIPFQTTQHPHFKSMADVHLWMIDQHLGRRSVSDFQRGVLALRKRDILEHRRAERMAAPATADNSEAEAETASRPALPEPAPLKKRADVAKAARLSSNQVVAIEKIHSLAVPEVVAAVKAGDISLNTAAAVAGLPAEAQEAAARAGKAELKQAAKRVRELKVKRPPAKTVAPEAGTPPDTEAAPSDEVAALRRQVDHLTTENEALRREVAELQAQLV